jgi:acyl-CoA thioester hydrolase
VDIGVAVVRLGNSSVTYETGLFRPGEPQPCAVGRMVHVFVDTATQRPVALPASIRAALSRLVRPV